MREIKHVNLKTYQRDGRKSIGELYDAYERFEEELWIRERIHNQKFQTKRKSKKHSLPILGFRTKLKGPAAWIISGIHGEEPSGPNAISQYVGFLNDLAMKIPLVVLPLCNPVGYTLNWRYPDRRKSPKEKKELVKSVGDSEHYLQDLKNPKKPRKKKPSCKEAEEITSFVLKRIRRYPPVLVLDFHEDESASSLYIYSQGKLGASDPVAKAVVKILEEKGFRIRKNGKTRYGQDIKEGITGRVSDGSIDELLASKHVIVNNEIRRKPSAKSVITIETSTKNMPMKIRVKVHLGVLLSTEKFFDMIKSHGRNN